MRSLAREPDRRHPSVQAFADDLARAAAGGAPAPAAAAADASEEPTGGLLGSLRSLFGRKRGE
jgi:hypothetical protein